MLKVGIYTKGSLTKEYILRINENLKELLGMKIKGSFVLENPSYTSISNSEGNMETRKMGLIQRGMMLQKYGAEALVIPHNGLNAYADDVEKVLGINVIKPASSIEKGISDLLLKKVGLIATKDIMNSDVIKGVLQAQGVEVILPDEEDQNTLEDIIYVGLREGNVNFHTQMQSAVMRTIHNLKRKGIEGCIIGCTDLSQLVNQKMCDIPIIDSIEMHTRDIAGLMVDSMTDEEAMVLGVEPSLIAERKNNSYKIFY